MPSSIISLEEHVGNREDGVENFRVDEQTSLEMRTRQNIEASLLERLRLRVTSKRTSFSNKTQYNNDDLEGVSLNHKIQIEG